MSIETEQLKSIRKKRVKYLILASACGQIHGSFKPKEREQAEVYLSKVKEKFPSEDITIHEVSNLNRFLADLRYGRKN